MEICCVRLVLSLTAAGMSSAIWPFKNHKYCELNLNSDLNHKNAPVLLRRGCDGYELASPDDIISTGNYFLGYQTTGVLRIPYGEVIYASCPGPGNQLHGLKEPAQFATLNCLHRRNILRIENQVFLPRLVRCTRPVTTSVRETGRTCGQGQAREYEIGYSISAESKPSSGKHPSHNVFEMRTNQPNSSTTLQGKNSFYHVLTCCYDPTTVRTLYAINTIQGDLIPGAMPMRVKPPYIVGQASLYPRDFDVHNAYKYPHQEEVLTKLLGRMKAESILNNTFIVRGQLAPARDFLMSIWKDSSYMYLNLVPQWQSINLEYWNKLEEKLQLLAYSTGSNFIIATGTHGVLSAQDGNDKTQELFLDPIRKLLPVPEYLWKLVFSPRNGSCIAFVMSNNPYLSGKATIDGGRQRICQDICHTHGWSKDILHLGNSLVYCCQVEELLTSIPHAPKFPCSTVLENTP